MSTLLIRGINPEPWATGTLGIGRKGGKTYPYMAPNAVTKTYKEALAEAITEAYPDLPMFPKGVPLKLHLVFWRQIQQYRSTETDRLVTRNRADATNLQKSTEDALQGILFKNDVDVRLVTSEIWEQGVDVSPQILVVCREYSMVNDWATFAAAINAGEADPWPEPGNVLYLPNGA